MGRLLGFLVLISTAGVLSGQAKLWIDSQGNRYEVDLTDSKLSFNCPDCKFEGATRVYELGVKVAGIPVKDDAFEGRQSMSGGDIVFTGAMGNSGTMRLKVQIPGVDDPFDLVLAPDPGVKAEKGKPSTIVLEPLQPSAAKGKWAPLMVHLEDYAGKIVVPEKDKDVILQIEVQGGVPVPLIARITKESPKVPIGISPTAGTATAKISAEGLTPVSASAIGCEVVDGASLTPKLAPARARGFANGSDRLSVLLTLVDAKDTPTSDGKPKEFGLDLSGVGQLTSGASKAITIPAGECATSRSIISESGGKSTVSVNVSGRLLNASVLFRPAITLIGVLMTLGAGLAGGLIAAGLKVKNWFIWVLATLAGALLIYGAYFYGLLEIAGGLPAASYMQIPVGLLGGYLGAAAVARLTRQTASSTRP